jgi:hypothetical protein
MRVWEVIAILEGNHSEFIGGVMSSHRHNNNSGEVPVELKYCEHCGGLWARERGAGVVYCERCQGQLEEMPMRKKKPGRVRLPVGPEREYEVKFQEELPDPDAVGGVA